jgi:universal stress protein A
MMVQEAASPVREILCPTDFSETSERAIRAAHWYAERFAARLHLLHVRWAGEDPVTSPVLETLAASLGPVVPVVTATESGSPAAQIVRYAERHRIDLIVVGTHGRTGVTHALLGSVAERVARLAPCPVLTVPPPAPDVALPPAGSVSELRRCVVCAAPSEDLICSPCRARIRGEAVERKRKEERPGRS